MRISAEDIPELKPLNKRILQLPYNLPMQDLLKELASTITDFNTLYESIPEEELDQVGANIDKLLLYAGHVVSVAEVLVNNIKE